MNARHMATHFHDEKGNYGSTNFFWDRLFGTFYERHERKEKSPTVFNLGYTEEVARIYPQVKELSGGVVATGHPRQRDRHRSEEHTSELQSLMRISYAVFCLKKKTHNKYK